MLGFLNLTIVLNNMPEEDLRRRRCKLISETPQPALDRKICLYQCKDDAPGWTVWAIVPADSKCPQWLDWIPGDRTLDPDNLPPDAIPSIRR